MCGKLPVKKGKLCVKPEVFICFFKSRFQIKHRFNTAHCHLLYIDEYTYQFLTLCGISFKHRFLFLFLKLKINHKAFFT